MVLNHTALLKGVNLLDFRVLTTHLKLFGSPPMKIVISALVALLLGAAVMSTEASAQPRCWYNGYNHCYTNGHHYGWWRHHAYWHRDYDHWYR
jgi:hypothetical protein